MGLYVCQISIKEYRFTSNALMIKVTHLICDVEDEATIDIAQEYGVRIVGREWLDSCLDQMKVIKDDEFLLDDDDILYWVKTKRQKLEKKKKKISRFSDEHEGQLYDLN